LLITASWAFVAVVAIALYRRDTEPSYNGRTFAQWIKASSQASADPATHEAILSITTNSAPLLLRWASRSSAWNWPCQRRWASRTIGPGTSLSPAFIELAKFKTTWPREFFMTEQFIVSAPQVLRDSRSFAGKHLLSRQNWYAYFAERSSFFASCCANPDRFIAPLPLYGPTIQDFSSAQRYSWLEVIAPFFVNQFLPW
jgi:hypothetical protein